MYWCAPAVLRSEEAAPCLVCMQSIQRCNLPLPGPVSGGVAKSYEKRSTERGGDKAQHARMGARPSRVSTKVVSAVADDMDRRVVPVSSRSPSKNSDERATTSVIGTLTEMQLEEFREAFHAFDKDGGGTLDKEELMELFQSLGQTPSSEELDRMVACADADGNETIDFFEVSRA